MASYRSSRSGPDESGGCATILAVPNVIGGAWSMMDLFVGGAIWNPFAQSNSYLRRHR